MNNTPRTDSMALDVRKMIGSGYAETVVGAEFSRALETELAASRAECERLREALSDLIPWAKPDSPNAFSSARKDALDKARTALRGDV